MVFSAVVAVLCGWALGATPARADGSPVFVVPGKPGVPVIVNPLGFDASYTVVEGDFGLSRPGQVNPVIVGGPLVAPAPYYPGGYFPRSDGQRPGYGRYEVDPGPNRRVPAAGADLPSLPGHRVRSDLATSIRRPRRRISTSTSSTAIAAGVATVTEVATTAEADQAAAYVHQLRPRGGHCEGKIDDQTFAL